MKTNDIRNTIHTIGSTMFEKQCSVSRTERPIWEDEYALAVELANTATMKSTAHETKLRASISRAYYAAFKCCRDFWRRTQPEHLLPSDGEAHREVRERFARYDNDPIKSSIANNMKLLLNSRRQADYNDAISDLWQIAETSLVLANRILNDVGSLEG